MTEKLRAPELKVDRWIQGGPLSMAELRGKAVLLDFWDYTCINCLHTLPYIREWHRRYADAGLIIIGLHAPEFSFAGEASHVEAAIRREELAYPVALDNGFRTWNAYANRAWPAKYLIDSCGYIRAIQRGEGFYQEFEHLIQQLLTEAGAPGPWPESMAPLREIDQPGAVCLPVTPELYLGNARGRVGNPEGNPANRVIDYAPPAEPLKPDWIYLEGPWRIGRECIESVSDRPARLYFSYEAMAVNLVAGSAAGMPMEIHRSVAPEGLDSVITIAQPCMTELIRHETFGRHRMTLEVRMPGLQAYALSFVSGV